MYGGQVKSIIAAVEWVSDEVGSGSRFCWKLGFEEVMMVKLHGVNFCEVLIWV